MAALKAYAWVKSDGAWESCPGDTMSWAVVERPPAATMTDSIPYAVYKRSEIVVPDMGSVFLFGPDDEVRKAVASLAIVDVIVGVLLRAIDPGWFDADACEMRADSLHYGDAPSLARIYYARANRLRRHKP